MYSFVKIKKRKYLTFSSKENLFKYLKIEKISQLFILLNK